MRAYRVHAFFGIVLVLVLAGVSLLPAARPAAVTAQGEYPRLIEITSLGSGDAFLDPIWLSGDGKRVAYGLDIGSEPGLYNQWYIADTDGLSPPQRLTEYEPGNKEIYITDINDNGSVILGVGWGNVAGARRIFVNGQDVTPCQEHPQAGPNCLGVDSWAELSGDGKTIYFVSDGRWDCKAKFTGIWEWDWSTCTVNNRPYPFDILWKMPASGGTPTVVLDDLTEHHDTYDVLDVSYDGSGVLIRRFIFVDWVEGFDLVRGGTRIPLPLPPSYLGDRPILSADGRWAMFSGWPDPPDSKRPYLVDLTSFTLSAVEIPDTMYTYYDHSGLSEDAAYLLLHGTDAHRGLWRIRRDGSASTRIPPTSDEYHDFLLSSMSYSGQAVAYATDHDDGHQKLTIWQGAELPDLIVDEFILDLAAITFSNDRYTLPVDVAVRNKGDADATNITVRFGDHHGWHADQTIDTLAIGATRTLHLDWDITGLLLSGKGQAALQLTVTADPDDAIVELSNLNNNASASLDVDVRPRITAVKPTFTLDKAYYLDRETLNNPIQVLVDWNGELASHGGPPYGDVYFDLNSAQVKKDGQQWGAEHTYDMGGDFQDSFSCANNTLRVWATYPVGSAEFRSLETTLQPTVFPWSGWVEWAIQNIPGSDASFEVEPQAPLVKYTYGFKYPEPAFEANWTPPQWIPYVGGEKLGLLPTQAEANTEAKSDGAGTAEVSGETGLGLAAVDVEGRVYGKGDTQLVCGESFDLRSAELGFEVKLPIEKEAGLVDLVPALKAAEKWPVVGRIIHWVNSIATVKGTFTPGIEIVTNFEEKDDRLEFVQGTGTGSIDASATLAIEPCDGLTANVYGGGKPYIVVQVPQNPGYLQKVGLQMYYGASFEAWAFEAEYERRVDCSYPGQCVEVEEEETQLSAAPTPGWRLIPRDYAGPDYAHPQAAIRTEQHLLSTDSTSTLLSNIYPRPEPSLALRADGQRLLTYVHDDISRPQGRGTEIYALSWDGASWSAPIRLTDDVQPDFAPAVTYDGSGMGVAVWERSTLAAGITPTLDITFAQSLEIAASTWNGAVWSAPAMLTTDSLMDTAPRLSAGADGSVMALWKTSDGEDILGTVAHPLALTYALWNGAAWSAPAPALGGLSDAIDVALAIHSSTQAALVYAMDGDGVISTTADSELYYSIFNGAAWSAPTALTSDAIPDITPALAYDNAGRLHLLWLRDGDLVWLNNTWNLADAQTVRAGSSEGGFLGFTLSRAPNGNLALLWQGMSADGADLSYSIYDAGADSWAADNTLTSGADLETNYSPAFGSDGTLYAAYRHVATEFVTRTFTISPTYAFNVTNFPQAGQSDLIFLSHTVGRDLTFDSLAITPTNPAPGQLATLTAILRNAGDLSVTNPQVAFYDGASQIGSTQTPPTLAAGHTTTVQIDWTVPSPAAAHTLKAVADPAGLVAETDESNNEIGLQTTLPDLRVDLLYTDFDTATITATARLVNDGVLPATAPFNVAFRTADLVTGTLLGTTSVPDDLEVGAQVTVTLLLSDPASLAGLGTKLWAMVDEGDVVAEADEENNADCAFLPLLPDLTLTAADISGDGPLFVTVHNAGVVTTTTPALSVWSGGLSGTLLHNGILNDLGPGASVTVTLDLSPGEFDLWAKVDPDNLIAESNEGNNLAVRAVEVPHRSYLPLILKH